MSATRASKAKMSKPLPPSGAPNKHEKANCPFHITSPEYQFPANPSPKDLVDGYINGGFQAHLERVLDIFRQCGFETAVRCAGLAQCPVCECVYPHQYRLVCKARQEFSAKLVQAASQFKKPGTFEQLWEKVSAIAKSVKGVNISLACYDAALRIAANRNCLPKDKVYAFRGAMVHEGQRPKNIIPVTAFHPEIADCLTAYQIEDFLCVWHKQRYDGDARRTLVPVLK